MIETHSPTPEIPASKDIGTKDVILEKAYAMMCLNGIKKLSMEELAQNSGVSRTAIYLHFKDRNELVVMVMKRMGEKDIVVLRSIAGERGNATEKLHRCLTKYVFLKIERCRIKTISIDELFNDFRQAYLQFRNDMIRKTAAVLTEVLVEGKLNGEFEFENAYETAESLILMLQAFMPYSLSNDELGDLVLLKERLDRVISMGIKSLIPNLISAQSQAKIKRFPSGHRRSPLTTP